MRKGFTVIEVVVVLGIFAVIAFMVGGFGRSVSDVGNFIEVNLQNQQGLEQVFQRMVTEIRSMGPSALGSYPLEAVATNSITFYSDIDQDTIAERVRYFIGTSTLEKGVISATGAPLMYVTSSEDIRIMATNVLVTSTTDVFKYYSATYTGVEAPLVFPIQIDAVEHIEIDISADINPGAAPTPARYNKTITIRNLRSN